MDDSIGMRWRIRITILMTFLLSACTTTPPDLSRKEAVSAILSWLDCDECYNGQYEYVISLGPQIKEELQQALDNEGDFADVLDVRERLIRAKARRIAKRQLGLGDDPNQFRSGALAKNHSLITERENLITENYVRREKSRHTRRATKALKNLSRRNPSKPRDPDRGSG